jgi:hypothetical protein
VLKEIPDEPQFTLELVYETPRDLYLTTTETGSVTMIHYLPSFTHAFSAPEFVPKRNAIRLQTDDREYTK